MNELEFDLSRSLKVRCDGVIVVSNSNLWPNSAPLRHIRRQNMSDLDLNLSRLLKVTHILTPYMS